MHVVICGRAENISILNGATEAPYGLGKAPRSGGRRHEAEGRGGLGRDSQEADQGLHRGDHRRRGDEEGQAH